MKDRQQDQSSSHFAYTCISSFNVEVLKLDSKLQVKTDEREKLNFWLHLLHLVHYWYF